MKGRQRVRRQGERPAPWYKMVITVLLVIGAIALLHKVYQWYEIQQEIEAAQAKVEALEQEKQSLQDESQKLDTNEEIEKRARKELGMVKPGEVPYVH